MRQLTNSLRKQVADLLESKKSDEHAIRQILDKTVTMLGTKDPMAYQQVMAMNQQVFTVPDPEEVYDSSDWGEAMKEKLGLHDPSIDDESDPGEIDVLARELGIT